MLIFIYGTLMKGLPNHHFIEKAEYITTAKVEGQLYHLPFGYPAFIEGDGEVMGKVCVVDNKTLKVMDALEWYTENDSQNIFDRVKVDAVLEDGTVAKVFVYRYCNVVEVVRIGTLIHGRDWKRYFKKN